MRNLLAKGFLSWTSGSVRHSWLRPFLIVRELSHLRPIQKGSKIPNGLHLALAKKGITVKDKAFLNLKPSELQDKGAQTTEIVGINSKTTSGFLAADIECASLILFGKSFADANGSKDALAALAAPVIAARNGIPLHARILPFEDSVFLLFATESMLRCCIGLHGAFLSEDAGAVLFSRGAAPFFRTKCPASPVLPGKPASVILVTIDSTCATPFISKISPGQAAYHFLAGYEDGKFLSAYKTGPSLIPPVELAKALLSYLLENNISSYLVNLYRGGKHVEGKELLDLIESAYSNSVPESYSGSRSDPKVAHLKGRYKSFMTEKFPNLPENVTF